MFFIANLNINSLQVGFFFSWLLFQVFTEPQIILLGKSFVNAKKFEHKSGYAF